MEPPIGGENQSPPCSADFYDVADTDPRVERIHHLRRLVLVHSTLYYGHDTNLVSDATYDAWAKELGRLQTEAPQAAAKVAWMSEAFAGFNGDSVTGFNLPIDDPWAVRAAIRLLHLHNQNS